LLVVGSFKLLLLLVLFWPDLFVAFIYYGCRKAAGSGAGGLETKETLLGRAAAAATVPMQQLLPVESQSAGREKRTVEEDEDALFIMHLLIKREKTLQGKKKKACGLGAI